MGLQRLQEFVPDATERLRLIQCIFKYKRDELASRSAVVRLQCPIKFKLCYTVIFVLMNSIVVAENQFC